MNDKTIETLSRDERSLEMGKKIWDVAQKVIGWSLVASIVWLINDRNSAWDAIDTNTHDLEIHAIEGKQLHSLLDRDLQDIDRASKSRHLLQANDIEQAEKYMDNLSDRLGNCELQVQRLWVTVAELKAEK